MRFSIRAAAAALALAAMLSAGGCASGGKRAGGSSAASAVSSALVPSGAVSSAQASSAALEQGAGAASSSAASVGGVSSVSASSSSASSAVPAAQTVTVEIDGRKGKGTDTAATLAWQAGDTAYSALRRACAQQGVKLTAATSAVGVYVKKIGAVAEVGGGTGWIYKIDGTFPGKAADQVAVGAGQRVVWVYTTDLGKSEGAPQG